MNSIICVITPVYNAKRFLSAAIGSVLKQTYRNWHLVLIDDGSTDGSDRICDEYSTKDMRIHTIHQENQGSYNARRNGVMSQWAKNSDYICFLDADDQLTKHALMNMIHYVEENQLDCVAATNVKMWRNWIIPQRASFKNKEIEIFNHNEIIDNIYISCFGVSNFPVSNWARLYRTNVISDAYTEDSRIRFMGDDLLITLRILPKLKRLGIVSRVVYKYRIGGNTSRFNEIMLNDFLEMFRIKLEIIHNVQMPQDAEFYTAVEIFNILLTWYCSYLVQGKHTDTELLEEIKRTSALPEIAKAGQILDIRNAEHAIAEAMKDKDFDTVLDLTKRQVKADRLKRVVKELLYCLQ